MSKYTSYAEAEHHLYCMEDYFKRQGKPVDYRELLKLSPEECFKNNPDIVQHYNILRYLIYQKLKGC